MRKIILIIIFFSAVAEGFVSCKDEKKPVPVKRDTVDIPIDKGLATKIDSIIAHVYHVGTLGLMFYDATAQKAIYAFHEDSLMRPASCMKMLTCIATLRTFGISAVSRNRLYMSGKMVGDTLVGNLTLKLQFDNFFTRDSLYKLTKVLKNMHVKKLRGRVILDMADYEPMLHEIHWTIGDLKKRALGLPFMGGKVMRREILYALNRVGIHVLRDSIVYGRLPYKASHLISEINTPMHYPLFKSMRNSSNTNAESLLYPLGYTISTKGNFRQNGTRKLVSFVKKELHMDPSKECVVHDGCGLCPDDRMSPKLLVALLNYAYHHKYIYKEVFEDMSLSGTDGTIHDRLYKPNVRGKIKGKTGTLTREAGISTLAGYYTAKDGHLIIFSIMNNECPVADGRWWQDKLLTKIVE